MAAWVAACAGGSFSGSGGAAKDGEQKNGKSAGPTQAVTPGASPVSPSGASPSAAAPPPAATPSGNVPAGPADAPAPGDDAPAAPISHDAVDVLEPAAPATEVTGAYLTSCEPLVAPVADFTVDAANAGYGCVVRRVGERIGLDVTEQAVTLTLANGEEQHPSIVPAAPNAPHHGYFQVARDLIASISGYRYQAMADGEAVAGDIAPLPPPPAAGETRDPCAIGPRGGRIDFESFPDGSAVAEDVSIGDQFQASHGVRFRHPNGELPRLAKVGKPGLAFTCSYCPEDQQKDALRDGEPYGPHFLIKRGSSGGFSIDLLYDEPASRASGVVIDLDGPEVLIVTAMDGAGKTIGSPFKLDANGKVEPGDGRGQLWSIDVDNEVFTKLRLTFNPSGNGGGIAIDHISPREICPL